ncbi:MAG: PepSY domain-containing protein [Hyphomicrobiales bacterium]
MQIVPILVLTTLSVVKPAAEPAMPKVEACLNTREMREAIAEHRAVQPLIALRAAGAGEKIRAQLCKTESGLIYLITALGRDGHVSRIFVDALSGLRVGAR